MTAHLHVHSARRQPATRYVMDMYGRKSHVFTCPPRTPWTTLCCKRRRIAANVEVQIYYDSTHAWCRPGTGCKRGEP